jgi:hypothetical protein
MRKIELLIARVTVSTLYKVKRTSATPARESPGFGIATPICAAAR